MSDPTSHPNVELFRRVVATDSDVDFWANAEADFEVRVPGTSAVSGIHRGREQVRAVAELEIALSGGTVRREPIAQFGDDRRVVALYRVRAERAGRAPLDMEAVALYRLREGRFTDASIFVPDQRAFDTFWSAEDPPRASSRMTVAGVGIMVVLALLFAAYRLGASTSDSSPRRVRHRSPAATPSIVIPTHSPVPPRPRSVEPFTGLGTWVDVYDRELWNDPTAAAASMQAQGIRTLYLQTSNYAKPYDLFEPAAMSALVEAAHAQGIKVVAWYLPGLANLTRDVRRSRAAIDFKTPNGQTFDGFGLDIEAQILDPPSARSRALLELSQRIRAMAPKLPLGAITPSPVALQTLPNGWPRFPWGGLNAVYDAFVPMDYFAATAHGRAQVQDYVVLSVEIIRGATGDPSVPIAPIGGIAQAVSAQEAQGFADAIQQTGSIGGSLYDFRTTTDPAVWAELKRIG